MPNIKIIRAAFREIQKLPPAAFVRVYEILDRLSQGDFTNTRFLEGYNELRLRRTRKYRVRVIWQEEDKENIVVIKAGWRSSVYDGAFESRDRANSQTIAELVNPQGKALAENPAYRWNHEQDTDWYKFVYGSYRYSPILTDYQSDVLAEPLSILRSAFGSSAPLSNYQKAANDTFEDHACIVVQSAPGTGKTVCATLFACNIHRERGWNTMLIVPEALRRDIAEYVEVKQVINNENFWLGTFAEWIGTIYPDFNHRLASPQQELEALQAATKFLRRTDITTTDVLLYQAFVLDEDNRHQNKNIMFKVNAQRIGKLLNINKKHWYKALACRLCRLDAANHLKNKIPHPPSNAECSILIIDEAQDFFLSELQAIIAVCKSWLAQGHKTYLLLLGDLNQRIMPTDFNWSQLHIKHIIQLDRNYRNSRQILEFAQQFWDIAQNITTEHKCKQLPAPAKPDDAFEMGEAVRLLEFASKAEAKEFLVKLEREYGQEENRRYLLHDLANAIKVLSNKLPDSFENIVTLNAEQAKGREFEACVAFCLFEGTGQPSLDESLQWYTLLTRTRSRLLVVVTTAEINRLNAKGHDYFKNCDRTDPQTAINWITEVASDMDISQINDDIQQRLLKRCENGYLYWDTYLALQLAGVQGMELYKWEKDAMNLLSHHSPADLNLELQKTRNISLRCLLLRTMEFSWEAVVEATQLKNSDFKEYQRLLKNIARDLETRGLVYEAGRVRAYLGDINYQNNFPFWQEVGNSANQFQPLVGLLCQAFTTRIDKFLQTRELTK
ncbi:MAG: hypothetical protein ACFKPT_20490 [Gloeotrichia echinulata GP01]